jgi:multiple sugar transport system permease protein
VNLATSTTASARLPAQHAPRRLLADLLPYLLLAPSVLMLLAVTVYPLLYSARISLYSFRLGKEQDFILLGNYAALLRDARFWDSLGVTVTFTFFAVSVEFLLGLGLALLLAGELRFRGFFRTALIIPMIVMPVVVGITWRLIYASDVGVVTFVARTLFGKSLNILGEPSLALPAVIVVDIWEWTPFMFLVLLAGLQSLPLEPFEAARVDGARPWQILRDLTLPMLKPVIMVALLIRTMDAFTVFDQIFVMTNGGPGSSTEVVSLFIYRTAFKYSLLGPAAAMVFVVLLILIVISQVYIRLLRDRAVAAR